MDKSFTISHSMSLSDHPDHPVSESGPWTDPSHDSSSDNQYAAIRLREGEDNSCLWQLRCTDEEQKTAIVHIFQFKNVPE